MVFRRPELEKDNPIASQPYLGPRRRRAGAHGVEEESAEVAEMKEVLQALTDAASQVVKGMTKTKATGRDLSALQDAIIQAERLLSAEGRSN